MLYILSISILWFWNFVHFHLSGCIFQLCFSCRVWRFMCSRWWYFLQGGRLSGTDHLVLSRSWDDLRLGFKICEISFISDLPLFLEHRLSGFPTLNGLFSRSLLLGRTFPIFVSPNCPKHSLFFLISWTSIPGSLGICNSSRDRVPLNVTLIVIRFLFPENLVIQNLPTLVSLQWKVQSGLGSHTYDIKS